MKEKITQVNEDSDYIGHTGCENKEWFTLAICENCHTVLLLPQQELEEWKGINSGYNSLDLFDSFHCCKKPNFTFPKVIKAKIESIEMEIIHEAMYT